MKTQTTFFEATSASDADHFAPTDRVHLWVVGVDRDPPPYGDGQVKILAHQCGTPQAKGGWSLSQWIAHYLSRGDRVFLATQGSEPFTDSLTDRYGRPVDPLIERVIRSALVETTHAPH